MDKGIKYVPTFFSSKSFLLFFFRFLSLKLFSRHFYCTLSACETITSLFIASSFCCKRFASIALASSISFCNRVGTNTSYFSLSLKEKILKDSRNYIPNQSSISLFLALAGLLLLLSFPFRFDKENCF